MQSTEKPTIIFERAISPENSENTVLTFSVLAVHEKLYLVIGDEIFNIEENTTKNIAQPPFGIQINEIRNIWFTDQNGNKTAITARITEIGEKNITVWYVDEAIAIPFSSIHNATLPRPNKIPGGMGMFQD